MDQIAALSQRIIEVEVSQPANELRDQRSVLVQKLSEIVDVHELESHGNYQLTIGGNRPLVYNGTATHLTTAKNASGLTEIMLGVNDITSEIGGGRLGGRLELRDQNIPQYLGALDQLAFELTQNVNAIHSTAYDLNGNMGNNFFTPLTGVAGAAQAIAVDPLVAGDPRTLRPATRPTGQETGQQSHWGTCRTPRCFGWNGHRPVSCVHLQRGNRLRQC